MFDFTEEYRKMEQEFIERDDALCQVKDPRQCNCEECPVKALCEWLHENDPYKENQK